jgi:hypothetical protein
MRSASRTAWMEGPPNTAWNEGWDWGAVLVQRGHQRMSQPILGLIVLVKYVSHNSSSGGNPATNRHLPSG